MKRFVKDFDYDEVKKVIEANAGLADELYNVLAELACNEVNAIMKNFNDCTRDWSINGGVYASYIRIPQESYKDFLETLKDVDDNYCIINDGETYDLFKRLLDRAEFFDYAVAGCEDISDEKFYLLEDWMDAGVKRVKNCLIAYCDCLFDRAGDTDEQTDFLFYNPNPDLYVLDYTYTAYEDITKCYA